MKKIMSLVLALVCVLGLVGCGHSNEGNYYIEETGKTYHYEIEMSGTLPNATNPVSFYVYTDDADLSFEDVTQALLITQAHLSSLYPNPELDFYISSDQIEQAD